MSGAHLARRDQVKLCHVVLLPELDGAQRCMFEILRHLDAEKYDRHVICGGEGPLTRELRREGIRVHVISSLVRPIRPLGDWKALGDLRNTFRDHAFDLVHTHSSKPGFLGRIAARQAGVRCIVHHVQGFAFHEYSHPLKRWLFARLERFAGRSSDHVIFVNNEDRELAIREALLPREKCSTVFNGVDLEVFDRSNNFDHRKGFRTQVEATDDEVLVLYAGRLDKQKQPLILPDIVARIEQERPDQKWRFLIAGIGPLHNSLEKRIRDAGVRHRMTLLGWHPEPQVLTSAADIALLPSLWEGLPLVLLEAQAAGLPIVASDIKGNREVVTKSTGFLCESKAPDSYARALITLLDNDFERRQFGAAGRRRAETVFPIQKNCRMVENLYLEHLEQRLPFDETELRQGMGGTR